MQTIREKFNYLKKVYPQLKDTKLSIENLDHLQSNPFSMMMGEYLHEFDKIHINEKCTEEEMDFVLHHEVRHAMQFKRMKKKNQDKLYQKYSDSNLVAHILENDANKFAESMTGKSVKIIFDGLETRLKKSYPYLKFNFTQSGLK